MKKQTPEALQQTRLRIIEAARDAFRVIGVKDVTMDSIARTLKMSKRTIYEVFPSKEELFLECIKTSIAQEDAVFAELEKNCENHLEYLLRAFEYRVNELAKCNAKAFHDIDAYPSVNAFFQEQYEARKAHSLTVLNKGIEEGFFRSNVNHEIAYFVGNRLPEMVIRSRLFDNVPIKDIFLNTVLCYLSGCVTTKGAMVMEEFFQRYETSAE
ncbi:MAG: TetR/AcrR family transcriptional regulator [Bacteroidales bacterium]|nr:TetR/AcrR family transcriptional regulator [Bacteroidales bacterium]